MTKAVCLRYKDEDDLIRSGIVTMEIEFTPSDLSISYMDVGYSDRKMMELIESKPLILRNVDSYLRNKLLKSEFNV